MLGINSTSISGVVSATKSDNLPLLNPGDVLPNGAYCIFSSATGINWAMSDTIPVNTSIWGADVLVPKATGVTDFQLSNVTTQAIIDANGDNCAAALTLYYIPSNFTVLPTTEGYLKMEQAIMPVNPAFFTPYDGLTFWTSTEADDDEAWYVTISTSVAWTVTRGPKNVQRYVWPIFSYVVDPPATLPNPPSDTYDLAISRAMVNNCNDLEPFTYGCLKTRYEQIYG